MWGSLAMTLLLDIISSRMVGVYGRIGGGDYRARKSFLKKGMSGFQTLLKWLAACQY